MKKLNDCHTCPFKMNIAGNRNIACAFFQPAEGIMIYAASQAGKKPPHIVDLSTDDEDDLLIVDHHGFKQGLADWPVQFDPTWVQCWLPVDQDEQKSDSDDAPDAV